MRQDAKPVVWMGSSRDDLRAFPEAVRRGIGQALYTAQRGEVDPAAKPLKRFGGVRVMEIVERHDRSTYRGGLYRPVRRRAVRPSRVQKKSRQGIKTPQQDIDLIRRRLAVGGTPLQGMAGRTMKKSKRGAELGSGNVFADLALSHPDQELLKARLTLQIHKIIKTRGLTQAKAAEVLGVRQPHVSMLVRNRAGVFSVERLMEFLTALGHDVEIRVRRTRKEHGKVSVVIAA